MVDQDEYEFIGSRYPSDESSGDDVDMIFIWYDRRANQYIEILANLKGSQWGQPVHILKMNLPILKEWIDYESRQEDEDDQYFT
jgi:hypothetical protein